MSSTSKRGDTDLMKLMMAGYKVELINDCKQQFCVELHGPKQSLYEGGVWRIKVKLGDDYPYKPPSIIFVNKIYHPNVESGSVCLNVLGSSWSPVFDLVNVFEAFLPQLLLYPNPEDPLNRGAGSLMLRDPIAYEKKVKEYCKKYANPPDEEPRNEEELAEEDEYASSDADMG